MPMDKSAVLQLLGSLKCRAESADDDELLLIKLSAREIEETIISRGLVW